MPTIKEYIEQLQHLYKPDETVAVHLWHTDDVIGLAKEMGYELSKEQAAEIIEDIHSHIDCEFGVTWETLRCNIEDYVTNNKVKKLRKKSA